MSEDFDVVTALEYCLECVGYWGDYVSDYFKEKHRFNEDMEIIKGYIESAKSMQANLDAQAEELAALREYATDYLDDLINDTSYRSPEKEIAYQSYVASLKFLIDKALLTGNSE